MSDVDLPTSITFEKLQERIGPALMRSINGFTTPIFYRGAHRGSAVLVTFKGIFGLLTAHHVIHASPKLRLGEDDPQLLQLKVKESGHSFGIPLNRLVELPIGFPVEKNNYVSTGPDLTFIKIPEGDELGTLRSLKTFYNLENTLGNAGTASDVQHCIVSGFPDTLKQNSEWRGEIATSFRELFLFGHFQPETYLDNDIFDTMSVDVIAEEGTMKPLDFGGVSGGSVWQFSIEPAPNQGEVQVRYPKLAGIVFYQLPRSGLHLPLIFHCNKSIEHAKRVIASSPLVS